MADFLTPADLVSAGQAVLRTELDPDGRGLIDLAAGSDLTTFISTAAGMLTPLLAHHAERVAARTLSGAVDTDLDEILQDDHETERKAEAAARTTLYLQRSGTAATSIPKGSRFAVPASGTQQAVVFAADATVAVALNALKAAVAITCETTGTVGNVTRSALTKIVDELPDTSWAIYTPSPGDPILAGGDVDEIGGGAEEETDDEAKARVRAGAPQPGTRLGIIQGTLEVPGIATAVPIEVGDGTGVVYAGDPGFALSSASKAAIRTSLEDWRPFGVPINVKGYTSTVVTVSATIYMERPLTSYDQDAIRAAADAAVRAYFAGRQHFDEYFLNKIIAALESAHAETQTVDLAAPVADVKRLADSAYSALAAMPRYVLDSTSVSIILLGPKTQ